MAIPYALIGGTGVYNSAALSQLQNQEVVTPYGRVIVKVGTYQGRPMAFLARHGEGHAIPPHLINYRANIWALKILGVQRVIATAAVGAINPAFSPGQVVFCDQFIDLTKARTVTFFEGGDAGVIHIDMTEPYCPELRRALAATASGLRLGHHVQGTYVCTEGPRFETPAEIRAYAAWGGDLVGMTGVPEVVLAREAGLCYAAAALVTNYAAGISQRPLTVDEVLETVAAGQEQLQKLIMGCLENLPETARCHCQREVAAIRPQASEGG